MREKYYAHRRIAFPPDHEREEEVDYEAGWERYGFAAPFSIEAIIFTIKAGEAQLDSSSDHDKAV